MGHLINIIERLRSQKNLADTAITFAVRVLSAFLAFGVQVFLARALGLGEYGIYATLWTWFIVVNNVSTLGFSESSLRFIPRYTHRGKNDWAKGFLSTGYIAVITGSVLIAILGISMLALIGDAVSPMYLLPIMVLLIGLPFTALEIYLEGVSRSFGWFLLTVVPVYILRPLAIAAGVLCSIVMGYEPNAAIVLGLAVAITAVISITQCLIIRSRIERKFGHPRSSGPKKFWIFASLPVVLTIAVEDILNWSDILILGLLVQPEEVSVYFAAQRSMSLAAFIQFAFMLVMVRDFSVANSGRDKAELQRRVTSASSWTFWLTIPSVLVTLLAGYPLLWMFGPEFIAGYPIMVVLGIAYIVRASTGQVQDLMIVLGHQWVNVYILSGCILLNVVLSILLVPTYGAMGVAIATAFTLGVRSVAFLFAAKKFANLWVLASIPDLTKIKLPKPVSSPAGGR